MPLRYTGFHGQEARSKFFVALYQGALFWGTLTATFAFMVFGLIKAEKHLVGLLVSVLLAVSAMILYMSLSDLRLTHTDIAIYGGKKQQNLIIQYYETGVTGNPRSRLIRTSNMNSSIRSYEEIHNAPVLDSLRLYKLDFEKRIPTVYVTGQDTFYLKKVVNPWKNNKRQQDL